MLTTSENTESTSRPGKGKVGVGGNSSDDGGHVDGSGGGGDKSVEKSSKSRRIVKESKSFKALRNLQRPSVRRNVYRSTDPPSKNSSFR